MAVRSVFLHSSMRRLPCQGVGEGWKASFLAFHPFHTSSFPWPALETRIPESQSPRRPAFGSRNHLSDLATIRPVDFLSIVFERETFIPARLRIRATPVRAPGPAETRPSNFRRAIQVGGRSEYVDGKHVR